MVAKMVLCGCQPGFGIYGCHKVVNGAAAGNLPWFCARKFKGPFLWLSLLSLSIQLVFLCAVATSEKARLFVSLFFRGGLLYLFTEIRSLSLSWLCCWFFCGCHPVFPWTDFQWRKPESCHAVTFPLRGGLTIWLSEKKPNSQIEISRVTFWALLLAGRKRGVCPGKLSSLIQVQILVCLLGICDDWSLHSWMFVVSKLELPFWTQFFAPHPFAFSSHGDSDSSRQC